MDSHQATEVKTAMLGSSHPPMAPANSHLHPIIPSPPIIDPLSPAPASSSSASSAAAVAPAPIPSFQPFSSNSQPIPPKISQQTQNNTAHQANSAAAAAASSAAPSSSGSQVETQKKNSKIFFEQNFLSSLFRKHFLSASSASLQPSPAASASSSASAPAPPPSSSSSSSRSLTDAAACHCLVVDDSRERLPEGGEDWKRYKEALALVGDHKTLRVHLAAWLKLPASDITIAYAPKQHSLRLHINFRSLSALGQALLAHPFLVRCGSIGSEWSKPCGDVKKQALPELLQLSCIPSHRAGMEKLMPDVTQLLSDMGLQHTSFWFPSAASRANAAASENNRVLIYVLPRNIAQLSEEIDRLHLNYELWGSKVRVQGMNTLALKRCNQCDNLGHNPDACLLYSGLALRLIGKKPLAYSLLQELQSRTGARTAFLGSGFDEMQPSRRLTLLFDIPAGKEEQHMTQLASHLQPLFADLLPLLHAPVQCVDIRDRTRECKECGCMQRPHECPFVDPSRARRPQQAPAASAASSAAAAGAEMCGSWKRTRACTKKEHGTCKYAHPLGYILPVKSKECFAFKRDGYCTEGTTCRYEHNQPSAATNGKPNDQAAPAAAAAAPASSSAPAPAASPSAKKKRPRASEEAPQSAAASSAATAMDVDGQEDADKQPSAAAAAKKQKPTLGQVIPIHRTRWGDLAASEDGDEKRPSTPPPPLRTSSLANISSPSAGRGGASASSRGRGGDGRPRPSSQAAASAAASAQPSTPSRSSSSSRKQQ